MASTSPYSAAYINGVEPADPLALAPDRFAARSRLKPARSPRPSASISRIAAGSGGLGVASPANSSGHSRALIDPVFEDFDVAIRKPPGRRHLLSELRADQLVVEPAAAAVARRDDRECAAAHRRAPAVEAESVHLLRGAVATDAVFPEQRLDVPAELDPGGSLRKGVGGHQEQRNQRAGKCSFQPGLHQNIARGFKGEPVPPRIGSGAAVSRNSHRLRAAAASARASRSQLSNRCTPR